MTTTKHGKIAEGRARCTFLLDEEVKRALEDMARRERRSLSNFLSTEAEKIVAEERAAAVATMATMARRK
jgi:hypothetical protein